MEIQLTIAINFTSWKDAEVECVMQVKCNNEEFMINHNSNYIVDKLLELLLQDQNIDERKWFYFDSAQTLY